MSHKNTRVVGRVSGHVDGFGFVIPEEGGDDLYLPPREMHKVFHGDRVVARVTRIGRRGRREGMVTQVLDSTHSIVGRYYKEKSRAIVIPEDRRMAHEIVIHDSGRKKLKNAQIVVAEITGHPFANRYATGKIVEVLGEHLQPGMETEIAIRKYELPHAWTKALLQKARQISRPASVKSASDGRKDIRKLPLVTIDGEDAKDFDDAVYAERTHQGWRLLVAIADVAHYVTPGSGLDREAERRGTSVYFPNRVIPMLPEAISNGICSLVPNEDRLCMVCDMRIGIDDDVRSHRFYEAVMHSSARLTYAAVWRWRQEGRTAWNDQEITQSLNDLFDLYACLRRAREKRGALDLDIPEGKFIFDDEQKIASVIAHRRNDAHRLIEECMLAANVCAAKYVSRGTWGALYRIHDSPDAERLDELRAFLSGFGLMLTGGKHPTAADFQQVAERASQRPELSYLIQTVLLRSQKKAIYSAHASPHFALGYERYLHFTSPIRRYPDLCVHRAIKAKINKQKLAAKTDLEALGDHCSLTERRADEATRDVEAWLKAEFMQDKIGQIFPGVVSGVTPFGLFVQLENIFIEGLVHVTELGDDYYHFDPAHHCLTGERTGKRFRLGDKLKVKLIAVNLDEAKIDFHLESERNPPAKAKSKGKQKSKTSSQRQNKFKAGKRRGNKSRDDKERKNTGRKHKRQSNKRRKR